MASRIAARNAPEACVRPPARMFTTVPMVAPAPGRPPDQPRSHVVDALTDQLPVRVVARTGHRIGYQGGEQAVDGAEERDDQRRLNGARQHIEGEIRRP